MKSRKLLYFILIYSLFIHQLKSEELKIPITITNVTNSKAEKFPVALGCPLPKGKYWDPNNFAIEDDKGNIILSQISALNRNWATDNSLKHLLIQFFSDVDANSERVYYLVNKSYKPFSPLKVMELENQIEINTGLIKVLINKKGFNLFHELYIDLDKDGTYSLQERILQAHEDNGGYLIDGEGKIQKCSEAPFQGMPFEVEIEETGPLRAVVRIDTYTYSRSFKEQYHGFQARMYFYAGSGLVRIQYTLKNSDHTTSKGRLFYFDEFSLNSKLNFVPNKITFGIDNGSSYTITEKGSYYLFQKFHDQFEINTTDGLNLYNGNKAKGWIQVSNNRFSVFAMIRNFWQTWPNALEYTAENQLKIGLWPRFSQDWWWNGREGNKFITNTGLYWLDDMQEVTKEVWYYFDRSTVSENYIKDLANLIQMPPIGSVPVSWYAATKVTLDLGGYIPVTAELKSNGTFEHYLLGRDVDRRYDWGSRQYAFGWFNYAASSYRRVPCTAGGWPSSGAKFLLTGHAPIVHALREFVLGELNARPWWLSGYKFEKDEKNTNLLLGYCRLSWRFEGNDPPKEGTNAHYWWPRNPAHLWIYNFETYYNYSGERRLYDWYNFIGEAMKVVLIKQFVQGPYTNRSTRGLAHSLAALIQAFRITGNQSFLRQAEAFIKTLKQRQHPYYGTLKVKDNDSNQTGEGVFQMGYLARALINYLEEIDGKNLEMELTAWGVLQGIMEWNLNLANYTYYWAPGRPNRVSGSGTVFADPEAWFYLKTGNARYRDHFVWFMNNGAYGDLKNWAWKGFNEKDDVDLFVGRITSYVLTHPRTDSIPPNRVTDLRARREGQKVVISWTNPQSAQKVHLRWSNKPISKHFTINNDSSNFWASEGIPVSPNFISPMKQTSISIDLSTFPAKKNVYFALVVFDDSSNMSEISNIAVLDGSLVGILDKKDNPKEFRYIGNFPNPFKEKSYIEIYNDKKSNLIIQIYDINGRLVKTIKKNINIGYIRIPWIENNSTLANGLYFIKVIRDGHILAVNKALKLR